MGTVVVGVDGSDASRVALDWAVEEARLRGATLEVVYVYEHTPAWQAYGYGFDAPLLVQDEALEAEAAARAAERAHGLAEAMVRDLGRVDVPIEIIAHQDRRPARALVELSKGAAMLVVGSRGRGGFSGLVLGSVSQQCVQHATCPVVVLPPTEDEDEET